MTPSSTPPSPNTKPIPIPTAAQVIAWTLECMALSIVLQVIVRLGAVG